MNTVVSNHYSGIMRFLSPVALVLLGLVSALLGYLFAWPFAIGSVAALVIWLLTKDTDTDTRNFFKGLSLTIAVSALALGVFGFIAVAVAAL